MVPPQIESTSVLHLSQLEEVGSGLNSTVYKLKGSKIVVKVPRQNSMLHHEVERSIYERFERLPSNANILKYLGETKVERSNATVFAPGLLFEYHPEGILRDVLETNLAPPPADYQKLRFSTDLASALVFVHSCHVVHGDIGLHNILFSREPHARMILADFGGSRIDQSQFLSWPSARYRMEGRDYQSGETYEPTEQHDIFALGMVIYEIMTWSQAWKGKEHPEVLALIRQQQFPDLQLVTLKAMEEVIGNCWGRQYVVASDLLSDLEGMP
ncbi:hypothetical protein BP5796_09800 [Coleophoma crateriformis]|uniref:Protein kinase domain-containing protein n=1 Tax=Coleophoma crateriformis TaxID=565419 RepID=A0A3D8QZG0_9HELO|nr:hypothetical protein BP5796_09800 [Coleophoma crateriformis]